MNKYDFFDDPPQEPPKALEMTGHTDSHTTQPKKATKKPQKKREGMTNGSAGHTREIPEKSPDFNTMELNDLLDALGTHLSAYRKYRQTQPKTQRQCERMEKLQSKIDTILKGMP